jgi:hypothetical protein
MSTSHIDSEIRSLPNSLTPAFIKMLSIKIEGQSNVDFVQAILCTFIRIHQDRITMSDSVDGEDDENQENIAVPLAASDLTNILDVLYKNLTESTSTLEQLYTETLPVLKWIKSALI